MLARSPPAAAGGGSARVPSTAATGAACSDQMASVRSACPIHAQLVADGAGPSGAAGSEARPAASRRVEREASAPRAKGIAGAEGDRRRSRRREPQRADVGLADHRARDQLVRGDGRVEGPGRVVRARVKRRPCGGEIGERGEVPVAVVAELLGVPAEVVLDAVPVGVVAVVQRAGDEVLPLRRCRPGARGDTLRSAPDAPEAPARTTLVRCARRRSRAVAPPASTGR